MVPAITRRRLLTLSVGSLAGLAGCQSLSAADSSIPVQIHVLNTTDEKLEIGVQLTTPESDVADQLGESLLMEPGMVERLDVTVPKSTYQLRVIVSGVNPTVEKTIPWEITGQDCAKQSYVTAISSGTETTLRVLAQNCEHT